MTPYEPRHEKACLGTDHLIFCGGGGAGLGLFLKIFFDRKTEIFFSHSPRAKIFFSGQNKNIFFFFFLTAYMLEMYSFRFIRSCIS